MTADEIKKLVDWLNSLSGPALRAALKDLTDEELDLVIGHKDTAPHVREAAEEIRRRRDRRDDDDDQPPPAEAPGPSRPRPKTPRP